jgi:hypothetical protein
MKRSKNTRGTVPTPLIALPQNYIMEHRAAKERLISIFTNTKSLEDLVRLLAILEAMVQNSCQ